MSPEVSIIMPAYNASRFIEASIRSVQEQTFTNWELIVVNDGSTDDTMDVVRRLQHEDNRIHLLEQVNKKQGAARNTGMKIAKGNWIAFTDADDLWMPGKLQLQLDAAATHHADVIYTAGIVQYEEENRQEDYYSVYGFYKGIDMYKMLYDTNPVPNLAVMMKKELISITGYQDEHLDVVGCEDWDYWIRLAKDGANFYGIPEKLFIYRVHNSGTSRNTIQMKKAELYAKHKNADYSVLDKTEITKRLQALVAGLQNFLLLHSNTTDALKHLTAVKAIYPEAKVNAATFLLKLLKGIKGKYIYYLLHPAVVLQNNKATA